jgi:protein-tyrosine phosphatase
MLMGELERFYEMVEMGALGQMDTGSITGQFGRRVEQAARAMLECGLIHFIASDSHNTRNRLPGMSAGVARTAEVVGDQYAHAISSSNPSAVIEGTAVPFKPAPALPKKKRKWLLFGK